MKTNFSLPRAARRTALLLATLLAAGSAAFAQNDPPRPPRPDQAERERSPQRRPGGDQPGQPGGQFGGQRGGGFGGGMMFNDPSLTEEQRTAIREATESIGDEMREVMERMGKTRRDLQEAIYAEKVDQDLIRKRAAEVGKAEGEMSIVRATIFAKIRPKLTAEQIERMKNPQPFGGGQFRGQRPDGDRPPGARPDGDQPGRRPEADQPRRRPGTGDQPAPDRPRRPAQDDK
ncbi:MAG: periplasmic heavy metal sensor [Verrucomicrobia bacterium]|nr:periplasmic heavy metal sensor [Verrucomicrobiota bacterium]